MRVILDRDEKREEPHPPALVPSSGTTGVTATAPSAGESNATIAANLPHQGEALQNSTPSVSSTDVAENSSLQGNQRRVGLSNNAAASPASSPSTDGQPLGTNGKQRAPASGGEASEKKANSDVDDVHDVVDDNALENVEGPGVIGGVGLSKKEGGDQRTQLRRRGGSGATGSAEMVPSSRERDACLTAAYSAPSSGGSASGSALRNTSTAFRSSTSAGSGNCAVGAGANAAALVAEAAVAAEVAAEEEAERTFEAKLQAKGWELRRQEGDGNCLFRAISQQIYGDPGMHADIRRQCVEFMRKERDHYSQFVSEAFESYVSRKEKDGVHGNNPEMQAASELFNRPIEVYVPERGAVPINIFHGGYRSGNAPIRVSYHGRSHYNAVIDPEEASIGQGLGVPGLSKEAAEKESLKRALAESVSSAHQVFPPGSGSAFFGAGGGRSGRSSFSAADFVESDLRATEEELEQAAISASLAEFHGSSDFGGSSAFGRTSKGDTSFSLARRGGRGSHSGLSSGRLAARGSGSSRSFGGGRGERRGTSSTAAWAPERGGGDAHTGRLSNVSRGHGRNVDFGEGGTSGNSPRKRRRPGSPNSPLNQAATRKGSPNSSDTYGNSADSSSAVREMVWSYGFPLARVLHAHDLVGDSVEDMLVLLTSDAFQPPENPRDREDSQGAAAAAAAFSDGV